MAAWYRTGTVAVTNGSPAVVGTLTTWLNQVRAGDPFSADGGATWYEILSVVDNTHLTLATNFAGSTASGLDYGIQRRTPEWTFSTELATSVNAILSRRSLILSGTGAPPSALGEDGYFYIDTASNELYGPKDEGAWGDPVSMTGLDAGLRFVWDTDTATSDPGAGGVKANHGTAGSMTSLFISETDADGNSVGAEIAKWFASTSTTKARLLLRKVNTPGVLLMVNVTAGADNGGWDTLTINSGVLNGVLSDGDPVAIVGLVAGDAGTAGANGTDPGLRWAFDSSTSMADPGTGDIRLNHATLSSVTAAALSDSCGETGNPDVSAWVLTFDDSTNTVKGTLVLKKASAPQNFAVYSVTGLTDNSGWTQLALTYVAHSGSFSSADALSVQFSRAGNGGGLTDIVGDTTPQLGGDLDAQGFEISRVGTLNGGPLAGFRNGFINGGFDIWQRTTDDTGVTTTRKYVADRFAVKTGAGTLAHVQRSTTVPTGSRTRYSMQLDGATGVTTVDIDQRIEAQNVPRLKRTITFCAFIYNGSGAAFQPTLFVSTPAADDDWTTPTVRNNGGSGDALSSCADGAWTVVSWSADVSGYTNIDNGLEFRLRIPSGSLVASDIVRVAMCQVDTGALASVFEHRPIGIEFALCERYLEELGSGIVGAWASATIAALGVCWRAKMRITPTITLLTTTPTVYEPSIGTRVGTASTIGTLVFSNDSGAYLTITGFSGATVRNVAVGGGNFLRMDAEL